MTEPTWISSAPVSVSVLFVEFAVLPAVPVLALLFTVSVIPVFPAGCFIPELSVSCNFGSTSVRIIWHTEQVYVITPSCSVLGVTVTTPSSQLCSNSGISVNSVVAVPITPSYSAVAVYSVVPLLLQVGCTFVAHVTRASIVCIWVSSFLQ